MDVFKHGTGGPWLIINPLYQELLTAFAEKNEFSNEGRFR
jgi:hypothetical protein